MNAPGNRSRRSAIATCAVLPIFSYTGAMCRVRSFTLRVAPSIIFALFAYLPLSATPDRAAQSHYGLTFRPQAKPWLLMPSDISGAIPKLLSQTGAFKDVRSLTPNESLIPYDLNVAFWSDGAAKLRWVSIPNENGSGEKVRFSATGEWTFPPGTVFVKT